MAHSTIRTKLPGFPLKTTTSVSDRSERRIRRVSVWCALYFLMQAELGLAWDRQWHDLIGRDQFWILPHIMMYSGIGAVGLIALTVVLLDTVRYYQGRAGVDETSTVTVLRFFHAPLGFIMIGFGTLTDLVAAPFDNYWHSLYGIDVTLWSPFHVMGTLGGIMAGLGMIYSFTSEVTIERQSDAAPRTLLGFSALEWGAMLLLAACLEIMVPAITAFDPLAVGPIQFAAYSIPLAFAGTFYLIGAANFIRKPTTALYTTLLLLTVSIATQAFVPWALHIAVAVLGLSYRFANQADRVPVFNITIAVLPLIFILPALLIDRVAYWQRQRQVIGEDGLKRAWLPGAFLAMAALFLPPCIIVVLHMFPALQPLPYGLALFSPGWSSLLFTLPFTLVVGGIGTFLGATFGNIWHWNRR